MMSKKQEEASKKDCTEESQQDIAADEKGIHNLRFHLWGWEFTGSREKQKNCSDYQSTKEDKDNGEPYDLNTMEIDWGVPL